MTDYTHTVDSVDDVCTRCGRTAEQIARDAAARKAAAAAQA